MRGAGRAALGAPLRWLAVAALSSIALLPLLPLLVAVVPSAAPLERLFMVWFDLHCERDPARILVWGGVPLAVCARCSGIYFGLGLGAALRRPRVTPHQLRVWVLAAAAFMIADVELERRNLHGAWPVLRVLTGLLLAYPVGVGLGLLAQRAPATTAAHSP